MIKKLLPLAVLLLAAACHPFKVASYQDDMAMPLAPDSPDSLLMSISLEYLAGGQTPVREAVNRSVVAQAFDLEDPDTSLEECAIRYRENLIDEYLSEDKVGPGTWEDRLEGLFMPDWKGWKNYTLSYYSYRGGAHGILTVSQLVFDAKTGALLAENDFFREGYREPVSRLLQAAVQKALTYDEELLPLVDPDLVAPNGNFSVDQEGITWVFQPYEIGPYALGLVNATVSWEDLTPYLK